MYNLQIALDDRLSTLNNKEVTYNQGVRVNDASKEYIERSLKQAGILNEDGKIIYKVTVS